MQTRSECLCYWILLWLAVIAIVAQTAQLPETQRLPCNDGNSEAEDNGTYQSLKSGCTIQERRVAELKATFEDKGAVHEFEADLVSNDSQKVAPTASSRIGLHTGVPLDKQDLPRTSPTTSQEHTLTAAGTPLSAEVCSRPPCSTLSAEPSASTAWAPPADADPAESSTCPSCPTCPTCPVCPVCPVCPSQSSRVPPGYRQFPGFGYYRMDFSSVPWLEAKASCERDGAHLAVIDSKAEADIINIKFDQDNILKSKIRLLTFVGFHDMYEKGTFITVLGQPLNRDSALLASPLQAKISGTGSFGKGVTCGVLLQSGQLSFADCSRGRPFVCELPL